MSSKKQETGGGGGHDGAGSMRWLLTYADLITLLMVFFVVLFAMSTVDAAKYRILSQSLGDAFSGGSFVSPLAPEAPVPPAGEAPEDPPDPLAQVAEAVNNYMAAENLQEFISTTLTAQGLLISFSGSMLFDLGKADIRGSMLPILIKLGEFMQPLPNPIGVIGSTDDMPINTLQFPSNWELSVIRSTTVVRFFTETAQLSPERFVALGYGQYHPVIPNKTEDARSRNRRVDIMIYHQNPFVLGAAGK